MQQLASDEKYFGNYWSIWNSEKKINAKQTYAAAPIRIGSQAVRCCKRQDDKDTQTMCVNEMVHSQAGARNRAELFPQNDSCAHYDRCFQKTCF
ncbi:hypothetical protein [Paenibacillus kandeliae]|uniref:hypothetical protein n=1 Tax=Paenibacillus kandeliae TaxID=3231269 RepID=UPI00345A08AA